MATQDFSPVVAFQHALSRWWIVFVCMFVGGILGWGFHLISPPIYESRATITVNIDFLKVDLTQYEEDFVINAAHAIANSEAVKNSVFSSARAGGLPVQPEQVQMSLEIKQSVWYFIVRADEPFIASELANIWSDTTSVLLLLGRDHALKAEQVLIEISSLESCFATGSGSTTPTPVCLWPDDEPASISVVDGFLEQKFSEYEAELELSQGIPAFFVITQVEPAIISDDPVQYKTAVLVSGGAFIGLIVSLWFIYIRKAKQDVAIH